MNTPCPICAELRAALIGIRSTLGTIRYFAGTDAVRALSRFAWLECNKAIDNTPSVPQVCVSCGAEMTTIVGVPSAEATMAVFKESMCTCDQSAGQPHSPGCPAHDGSVVDTFEFTVYLGGIDESLSAGDVANRLYDAGCDDATVATINGEWSIMFTRQSLSLWEAVGSALRSIAMAGIDAKIDRILMIE